MKRRLFILLIGLCLFLPRAVHAQSAPSCSFEADGSIVCTTGGGGGGGGGENGSGNQNPEPVACTPGATHQQIRYLPNPALGARQCTVWHNTVVDCTDEIIAGDRGTSQCPQADPQPQHPRTTLSLTSGAITCEATEWNLQARMLFPEIHLDVHPYPVTLVRWPTALRNGGTPESSGSGRRDYVSMEGDYRMRRRRVTGAICD